MYLNSTTWVRKFDTISSPYQSPGVFPHLKFATYSGGTCIYILRFHFNFMQNFRFQCQFEGNGLENNFGLSVKLSLIGACPMIGACLLLY